MAQVVYSEETLIDFERIIESLQEISSGTAAATPSNVRSAIQILATHPLIGRRVDDRIRELVISRGTGGYLALYRFDPPIDKVRILRIRHQREAGYRD
jgi:plasmid stabilization system protein ParE